MSAPARLGVLAAAVLGTSLSAQIATAIIETHRSVFHAQATDADMKREGRTTKRTR